MIRALIALGLLLAVACGPDDGPPDLSYLGTGTGDYPGVERWMCFEELRMGPVPAACSCLGLAHGEQASADEAEVQACGRYYDCCSVSGDADAGFQCDCGSFYVPCEEHAASIGADPIANCPPGTLAK